MISKSYIKLIQSLDRKKSRDEQGKFVLEGEKMLLEILNWKSDFLVHLFYTEGFRDNVKQFDKSKCTEISEKELKSISRLQTPNKALAIFQKWDTLEVKSDFYLALDGVQDPGNMGTIMRLADWFGVPEIICSKETVDCFNPKVVQATMGAIFRVQVRYVDLEVYLPKLSLPIYGALLEGENVYRASLLPKGVLVLGNEGKGISLEVQKLIDHPISIPRFGEAESLNVSTAGAILLSEFFRTQVSIPLKE